MLQTPTPGGRSPVATSSSTDALAARPVGWRRFDSLSLFRVHRLAGCGGLAPRLARAARPPGCGSADVMLSSADPCCFRPLFLNQMRAAPTGAVQKCAHVRDAAAGTIVPADDRGTGHQPAPRRLQNACGFDAPLFLPIIPPIALRASGGKLASLAWPLCLRPRHFGLRHGHSAANATERPSPLFPQPGPARGGRAATALSRWPPVSPAVRLW